MSHKTLGLILYSNFEKIVEDFAKTKCKKNLIGFGLV